MAAVMGKCAKGLASLLLSASLLLTWPATAGPYRHRDVRPRATSAQMQRFRNAKPYRKVRLRAEWRERLQLHATREARQKRNAARQKRFQRWLARLHNGDVAVRGEVVATDLSDQSLARARQQGFDVVRERTLEGLGQRLTVLQAKEGIDVEEALARLRVADPEGDYDFNHVMDGSGEIRATRVPVTYAPAEPRAETPGALPAGVRIGLIDSGVDASVPALQNTRLVLRNFTDDGEVVGDGHGTAIASLLVGNGKTVRGMTQSATLYGADVFGDAPTGGAADAVVEALAWLAREQVPVINISLVGPRNRAVEKAIATLVGRGVVIVAAVGNDGPASPPLYPAAYPGVIGVTAVDRKNHVLVEANQGPQVTFAAIGNDIVVTDEDGAALKVRGTSFAAPVVTARFAAMLATGTTKSISDRLAQQAVDLGARGRDDIYGLGLISASATTVAKRN
jgi:hypothetical protein